MMDSHHLELAFYRRLIALTYNGVTTLKPDDVFNPESTTSTQVIRRGQVISTDPETVGFGNGVYTRLEGLYQVDLWMPRANSSALKDLRNMTDAHVAQFWPSTGRGLTLTEEQTSANVVRRPAQHHLGREGAYLRETISVTFYVEELPSA